MNLPAPVDISIIIPAKDEAKRLPDFLRSVMAFCRQSRHAYEVIVVDDGSKDKTSEIVRSLTGQSPPLRLVRIERNAGKGFAVKQGFRVARGDIVLFLDADGSTKADEIEKNLHYLYEGYAILIGSRVLQDPACPVKARWHRKFMGKFFNLLTHTFLLKEIRDSQCGFKMFRKEIIPDLFEKLHIRGFGFDLEILFLASNMGLKIKEVPVAWTHVKGSKVNLFTDSVKMTINIWQIRKWHTTR